MANFPQSAVIPSAVKTRSKFDLSNDNITTSDFFKVKPSRIIECMPGDSFNIQSESLIRMYPLAVPTFGRMNHFMRWYWVPMRTLMKGWNEFIEQTPFVAPGAQSAALIPEVPYFLNSDIVQLFFDSITNTTPIYGYYCTRVASSVTPDAVISYRDTQQQLQFDNIQFTEEGRALMDILQNLGYNINMDTQDKRKLSALPLLAFVRVMADFYLSPQYLSNIQALFNVTTGNIFTQVGYIQDIFHDLLPGFSNYDPDLFVSAWDNPISPNLSASNPTIEFLDLTVPSNVPGSPGKVTTSKSTPLVMSSDTTTAYVGGVRNLSDYLVKSLRAVTNYAIRNNIAGYKFWDRLEAEYGAVMDYKEKGTSLYIDSVVTQVKIAPVVSTADTSTADLGALAGQGLGYNQGKPIHFNCKNEWGYLIAVSSLVPVTGYFQGTQKHCRHIDPLHFFHGDFESLGVDAIQYQDLFSSFFNGTAYDDAITTPSPLLPTNVFGFTPRYSEYKTALNTLSGNFRVGHLAQGNVHSYHLMRQVGPDFDWDLGGTYESQHNQSFVQGHNAQFDRIFANTDPDEDHFILIHHHEVHAERNMKSLSETIFDNEDFEHNKKVEVQYNGSQFN